MRVGLSDGVKLECEDEPIGEGASGRVYRTLDGQHVVKLFKQPTTELQRAMEKILGDYNCVANDSYWAALFRWPDALVVEPTLGIRIPAIPDGFRSLTWFVLPRIYNRLPVEQRAWYTRMLAALRLVRAVGRMHRTGLAHSDLSPNNIYIHPLDGRVTLIDLDGLVVKGFLPPQVVGTPEYIAPELLTSKATPSAQTDLHALAVLLYQLLLYRHPFRGPKVYARDTEEDERIALGPDAVFIDHPTDTSNRPTRWEGKGFWSTKVLGGAFPALFERAFVAGLKSPSARPTAGEWETALVRLADRVVSCSSAACHERYFPISEGVPLACPWCGASLRIPQGMPLLRLFDAHPRGFYRVLPDGWVAGLADRTLHRWHVESGVEPGPKVDPQPVARLEVDAGGWSLRNLGLESLAVVQDGAVGAFVPVGQRVALEEGTQLLLSAPPRGRACLIQRLPPRGR